MARINPNDADKYQKDLNGEWFSLKNDGDVARVQFMVDTFEELDVFACHKVQVGDKERYVDCLRTYDQPIDDCPFCAAGIPVKPVRFVIMFQHDDNKVKIWERGKKFIAKIQGLMNRYQPLSEYVFEIERKGKAGSKETTYEVFPMDKVPAFDLTETPKPDLEGGLILQKTFEEMQMYLDMGSFPEVNEGQVHQPAQQQVNRRQPAPTNAPTPTAAPSRRGALAPTNTPAPSSRRGAPVNKEEVF